MVSLTDIWHAKNNLKDRVHRTNLIHSSSLSTKVGAEVYLKCENFQKTGAFKVRGAFNKILSLSQEKKQKGVVAFSSGNFAQAVAYAATSLGIPSTIVMPQWVSKTKAQATKAYGATVIIHGNTHPEIHEKALEIKEKYSMELLHPYDDPKTIAGQGTIGLEILDCIPDIDTVFVPIGGGGLISGIGVAVKSILPKAKLIGVEPKGSCSMYKSREAKKRTAVQCSSIADGLLVEEPGNYTYDLTEKYVDEIITVKEEEIEETVLYLLHTTKMLVEPSGAVSVAGLLSKKVNLGKNNIAVISGGNCNFPVLEKILGKYSPNHMLND